jgi:8-hydroxy-5-deazaflavin:NADPH oxidoreductase
MKLAILGTGDMGGAIATAFSTRTRHTVVVRGATPGSGTAAALVKQLGVAQATDADLKDAGAVFVAVHWAAIDAVARDLKDAKGLVVSAMVPWSPDGDPRQAGDGSAAQRLAAQLPKARVVTAFTTIFAALLRDPGTGEKPSVFLCADDARARKRVAGLVEEVGFEPVNAGRLDASRAVEDMGLLTAHLAYGAKYGERVSLKVYVAPQR